MTITESDLAKIKAAIAERERARQRLDRLVFSVRDAGATWTEIGYALGMTAQGAQKRYGSGSERAEAHREAAAKNALKKRDKGARAEKARRELVDPWPDGTGQAIIDSEQR